MPLRILIVDDSEVFRSMLGDMIDSLGHQVVGEAESLDGTLKAYKAYSM